MLRRRCVSYLVLPYLKSRPGKHKAQAFQKGCYAYYLQHEARSTKNVTLRLLFAWPLPWRDSPCAASARLLSSLHVLVKRARRANQFPSL
jgi:hypothetical protein